MENAIVKFLEDRNDFTLNAMIEVYKQGKHIQYRNTVIDLVLSYRQPLAAKRLKELNIKKYHGMITNW